MKRRILNLYPQASFRGRGMEYVKFEVVMSGSVPPIGRLAVGGVASYPRDLVRLNLEEPLSLKSHNYSNDGENQIGGKGGDRCFPPLQISTLMVRNLLPDLKLHSRDLQHV